MTLSVIDVDDVGTAGSGSIITAVLRASEADVTFDLVAFALEHPESLGQPQSPENPLADLVGSEVALAALCIDLVGSTQLQASNPDAYGRIIPLLLRELAEIVGDFDGRSSGQGSPVQSQIEAAPPLTFLSGNTGYTLVMAAKRRAMPAKRSSAKVMVSLPEDLLERIDTHARARRATRSGFLRELAERELNVSANQERSGIEALLGDPVRLGGDATNLIRADRRSR